MKSDRPNRVNRLRKHLTLLFLFLLGIAVGLGLYYWIAPYSYDIGIFFDQIIYVTLTEFAVSLFALLLYGIGSFRAHVGRGWLSSGMITAIWLGLVLGVSASVFAFPAQERLLPVPLAVKVYAQKLQRGWSSRPDAAPWYNRVQGKKLTGIKVEIPKAVPKGAYGLAPAYPWKAQYTARYKGGTRVELTLSLYKPGMFLLKEAHIIFPPNEIDTNARKPDISALKQSWLEQPGSVPWHWVLARVMATPATLQAIERQVTGTEYHGSTRSVTKTYAWKASYTHHVTVYWSAGPQLINPENLEEVVKVDNYRPDVAFCPYPGRLVGVCY